MVQRGASSGLPIVTQVDTDIHRRSCNELDARSDAAEWGRVHSHDGAEYKNGSSLGSPVTSGVVFLTVKITGVIMTP